MIETILVVAAIILSAFFVGRFVWGLLVGRNTACMLCPGDKKGGCNSKQCSCGTEEK